MKYGNFIMKIIALIAIVGGLSEYQKVAIERATVVEERETIIAEIEKHNAAIIAKQNPDSVVIFKDGKYQGTGTGFGGEIIAEVEIKNGEINNINIISAKGEDPAYYEQAVKVLDEIKRTQDPNVDTISGATFSSGGIIEAVTNALEGAREA